MGRTRRVELTVDCVGHGPHPLVIDGLTSPDGASVAIPAQWCTDAERAWAAIAGPATCEVIRRCLHGMRGLRDWIIVDIVALARVTPGTPDELRRHAIACALTARRWERVSANQWAGAMLRLDGDAIDAVAARRQLSNGALGLLSVLAAVGVRSVNTAIDIARRCPNEPELLDFLGFCMETGSDPAHSLDLWAARQKAEPGR